MNHDDLDDEAMADIVDRIAAFVGERTGLPRDLIETVMAAEADYWESHPALLDAVTGPIEEDEG